MKTTDLLRLPAVAAALVAALACGEGDKGGHGAGGAAVPEAGVADSGAFSEPQPNTMPAADSVAPGGVAAPATAGALPAGEAAGPGTTDTTPPTAHTP